MRDKCLGIDRVESNEKWFDYFLYETMSADSSSSRFYAIKLRA